MKIKWEYMTLSIDVSQGWGGSKGQLDPAQLNETLNGWGADGWELVSTEDLEHTAGSQCLIFILKRQK